MYVGKWPVRFHHSAFSITASDLTAASALNAYIGIGKIDIENGNTVTKLSDLEGKIQSRHKAKCSIPDDHIDPRRSALFMARSVLRDIQTGDTNAC